MKILVATDAWRPQVNGVVRSLEYMAELAPHFDAELTFLTPALFRSVPMPTYPEIRLALSSPGTVRRLIEQAGATHIHIATEGPIGLATRLACRQTGRPFTTSYHTRFPEYLAARMPVPEALTYGLLRRFHNSGRAVMVSTPSLEADLESRGFENIVRWTRGVDTSLFRPRAERVLDARAPIFLYVGRVAVEKNIEAFLKIDLPGTKMVVGDGPALTTLRQAYPNVLFPGVQTGEALARLYASADVFVFPSLTDTFGIVLLEALASGLPIAAFPVTGPTDVLRDSGCGVLSDDLREAALGALDISRARCRAYGESFTWMESAGQFFGNIVRAANEVDKRPIR